MLVRQQRWEAGIFMLSQRPFMKRQQACSSTVIEIVGMVHAIAGASNETRTARTTAIWRRARNLPLQYLGHRDERVASALNFGAFYRQQNHATRVRRKRLPVEIAPNLLQLQTVGIQKGLGFC